MSTQPPGTWGAIREGWRAVALAGWLPRIIVALLFLNLLLMYPLGRNGPEQVGSVYAPLSVDAGYLFKIRPAADFFSVYDAGTRLLNGQDPYGVNTASGGAGLRAPYVATFRYLPVTVFWLAVPLNVLPPWAAYYTWTALNLVFIVAGFLLTVGRRPDALLTLALVWFAWFPVVPELHMGQFTLFMAVLMLFGFDAIAAGRKWGGAAWMLAALLKVYPLAMAPSLFLWGRRNAAVATVSVAVVTTAAWSYFSLSQQMNEGLVNRGIAGRMVGEWRDPYAGAMGVQSMVNAVAWKAAGRSFRPGVAHPAPSVDPAFFINATLLGVYTLVCGWALWRTRRAFSLAAIGLFWLVWFHAYVDCWEHHYTLVQSLAALLLAWRVIGCRTAAVCWLLAGTPSLWWPWFASGYAGNATAEALGILYFLPKPLAVLLLTVVLIRAVAHEGGPKT